MLVCKTVFRAPWIHCQYLLYCIHFYCFPWIKSKSMSSWVGSGGCGWLKWQTLCIVAIARIILFSGSRVGWQLYWGQLYWFRRSFHIFHCRLIAANSRNWWIHFPFFVHTVRSTLRRFTFVTARLRLFRLLTAQCRYVWLRQRRRRTLIGHSSYKNNG